MGMRARLKITLWELDPDTR